MMENTESVSSIWKTFRSVGGLTLLWNLVLALGGVVMLIFVVNNGFLPELDLSGALSLLASASLVSLFLIFAVSMLTFAGGWALYSWFEKIDFKVRGRTSGLLAMFSASAVYAALTVPGEAPLPVRIVAIAVLVMMTIWCGVAGVLRYRGRNLGLGKELGLAAGALFVGTLFAISHAMVLTQLYRVRPGVEDVAQWAALAAWLTIQAVCIGAVASSRTPAALFKVSGAFGAVGLFLLLLLSNNPTFLVERMARILGIGALPNISLAVTQEGCQVLNVLSDGALCMPVSDRSVYLIEPITLRSRFGKQVLIEYTSDRNASGQSKKVAHEVVLQASEVLGWQRPPAANESVKYE